MTKIQQQKLEKLHRLLGNTPIMDMGEDIFGKLEGYNPTGSIKDRAAFYILKHALENGQIKNNTIVEATSGNTGIGLAYYAKELGLDCVITMPESMSAERRALIAQYGARLELTQARLGMSGAVERAKRLEAEGAFLANQFGNVAGVEAHYLTTAPELFSQLAKIDYIVCGIGSGGTAMGFAKYISENNLDCKLVGVEPASSPLISKGKSGVHSIQGIGANFIPAILDVTKIDLVMTVSDKDAIETTTRIYKETNQKCGISSGAAYFAALQLRKQVEGTIAVILPDNGKRYSQDLYAR